MISNTVCKHVPSHTVTAHISPTTNSKQQVRKIMNLSCRWSQQLQISLNRH